MINTGQIDTREDLRAALQQLFHEAEGGYVQVAAAAGIASSTLHAMVTGQSFPRWSTLKEVLAVCGIPEGEFVGWRQAHMRAGKSRHPSRPGVLLSQVTDPFMLEVHRPITADGPGSQQSLPVLPPYVWREHDARLAEVVSRAVAGYSGMAVLVGESSTGKTRACWEALAPLREQGGWRLWHPFDPTRPEATLANLSLVGPKTVMWLNETQFYLDTPTDLGERVASALRSLLTQTDQAPLLVLGTLWPQHWDDLTSPTTHDPTNAQARALLAGRRIHVPVAFTDSDLQRLFDAAAQDSRLIVAASQANDSRITQFLAGVPTLLDRYEEASPAVRALVHAAMDARRMGCGIRLPLALLADAAAGYMSDFDWDGLADDWLEQALAYAARPCNGIPGPLTRIRPRSDDAVSGSKELRYRLADYLEQTGRHTRHSEIPPPAFWAAIRHADPGDLTFLAQAAGDRGLLRTSAHLWKQAAVHGESGATAALIELLHTLDPTDHRPQRWAVTRIGLDKPHAVADLLHSLRKAGAHDDVATLLSRDPASQALLDYPFGVISLLDALRAAEADQQVLILAGRAAAEMRLIEPISVVALLDSLVAAGAETQALLLAERAAAWIPLDFPDGVARLLDFLLEVGTATQIATLLGRNPSAHALLDDPGAVADLLNSLRNAAAYSQVTTLLGRNPSAHVPIDDPEGVDALLHSLLEAGAEAHAVTLLRRDTAAHVSLDDRSAAYRLLDRLRNIGADVDASVLYGRLMDADSADPMARLAERLYQLEQPGADTSLLAQGIAEQVPLDDPIAMQWTLRSLWNAGANAEVFILAERAAKHLALENPYVVADALNTMRKAGADAQVAALLKREVAARARLDRPLGVAALCDSLRQAGAIDQASALAWRAAEGVVLEEPDAVASLLESLQNAGFATEVRILVERLPAAGMFSLFLRATTDGMRFRYGREADGRPSTPWSWDDLERG